SQMYELHGLQIELQAEHSFYLPDQDMRVLLFHVVRELLFNVKKHAAVVRATVSLREEDDELVIEVSDDGRGFDTAGLGQRSLQDRGFGLFSIRERLKLLGGKLQVVSAPDEGTRVIARVPVQP